MAFTVNLTIRGLVAFVPSEPVQLGELKQIAGMSVLVVDARAAEVIPPQPGKTDIPLEICAHLPLLRFPRPEENKLSGFWILDGHQIEILGVDAQPLTIMPSFDKGAQMERIVGPNVARVASRFFDPLLPAGLAGRMDLAAGTVETFNSQGFWEILPAPAKPYADRFAAAVRVSIPIADDQALLRATARTGDVMEQVLRPKRNNQSVDLLLSNLCFEESEQDNRRVEGDFAVFYKLLDNYNSVLRVPHKASGPTPGGGQGVVQGGANSSPSCVVAIMGPRGGQ
jgi:hypothetical protein